MPDQFILHSEFQPAGDQPEAIAALVGGIREKHLHYQTLQGVTGSGKTFTMANVIQRLQMPTLVISHNKTLAAQLYSELKAFFPENAVEYFVSYYDYYQPEAYIPSTDTYIAKDSAINDELERLRLAATGALLERRDVIVVASVSCIYGMGDPEEFASLEAKIVIDQTISRDDLLRKLVFLQYTRNDLAPERGQFRASGDTVEVYLSHREDYLEIQFWGDSIESMCYRNVMTHTLVERTDSAIIFPCKLFVTSKEKMEAARRAIQEELREQVRDFEERNKLVEAQRIHQRTTYDLEMLQEVGYCQGIENYSRHLSAREPGSRPFTLIDYFPREGFLTIIDESHVTLPQLHAMQNADRNRKMVLVENGFRLPSALDNRPLTYNEFRSLQQNVIFVSATPGAYELSLTQPVRQIIRPTGLLDPKVEVRPLAGQVDDAIEEIRRMAEKKERVLVTTLTKRMAEELSEYLRKVGLESRYLHSDLDALERVEIIRGLRAGDFDCLVGINLLREGLDLPEVALVMVMDADKEGFLRSASSLIQTAGRAARNAEGRVILYADVITDSIQRLLQETEERRERQMAFNQAHGITPKTIRRAVQASLHVAEEAKDKVASVLRKHGQGVSEEEAEYQYDLTEAKRQLEEEMQQAADALEFLKARGIEMKDREVDDEKHYGESITIDLKTSNGAVSVRGTLTENHLMLSRINNFDKIYLDLSGSHLFVEFRVEEVVILAVQFILGHFQCLTEALEMNDLACAKEF